VTIPAGQLIVLDTNILVDLVRNNDRGRTINGRFQLTDRAERPLFSTVTEGEIFGLVRLPKWRWGEAKLQKLEELLANLVRVNAGLPNVVDAYAELYAASYATGNSTGDNDLWIAATAKATGSVLLTRDAHFDWMNPTHLSVERVTDDA
jgi:tRNA(fMet)-specific endonuclease VapC